MVGLEALPEEVKARIVILVLSPCPKTYKGGTRLVVGDDNATTISDKRIRNVVRGALSCQATVHSVVSVALWSRSWRDRLAQSVLVTASESCHVSVLGRCAAVLSARHVCPAPSERAKLLSAMAQARLVSHRCANYKDGAVFAVYDALKATRMDAKSSEAHATLGLALETLGRFNEAAASLQMALDLGSRLHEEAHRRCCERASMIHSFVINVRADNWTPVRGPSTPLQLRLKADSPLEALFEPYIPDLDQSKRAPLQLGLLHETSSGIRTPLGKYTAFPSTPHQTKKKSKRSCFLLLWQHSV